MKGREKGGELDRMGIRVVGITSNNNVFCALNLGRGKDTRVWLE